jgi:hypothetical protein
MQNVQKWLDGPRNFLVGRAIYNAIGKDANLKSLLLKGETKQSLSALVKGMEYLLNPSCSDLASETKALEAPKKESNPLVTPTTVMPDSADRVLQAIKNEWQKPYKEMCYLQGQLDQFGASNDPNAISKRQEIAIQILDMEKLCMKAWAKRDYYQETGELMEEKKFVIKIPTSPKDLAVLINRIKKNIRNNRLSMSRFPENPVYAKKYLEYKQKYQQVTGEQYQEKDEK